MVDTTPNCGNILAGVGPFAIERKLVPVTSGETRVRVKTINTGTRAELVVSTPNGVVEYDGEEAIDGVPGTAAAIPINFLDTAGSVCGSLFPTGQYADTIDGVEITCIDNGMPVVLLRANDFGFTGHESCQKIEAETEALRRIESIRLQAGRRMGLGDVGTAVVPKMCLISTPENGGSISTRSLIPWKCHASIGALRPLVLRRARPARAGSLSSPRREGGQGREGEGGGEGRGGGGGGGGEGQPPPPPHHHHPQPTPHPTPNPLPQPSPTFSHITLPNPQKTPHNPTNPPHQPPNIPKEANYHRFALSHYRALLP